MKKLLLSSLLVLTSQIAWAQNSGTQETTDPTLDEALKPAATPQEVKNNAQSDNAYRQVREQAGDYVREKRAHFSQQGKNVLLHYGAAPVRLPAQSKGWGDARVLAYKDALQQARESMIRQLYMDVATETTRRAFKTNQGPEIPDNGFENQNAFSALLDKWVAIKGATYDEELRKLGIDPEQYDAAPPSVRKRMMEKSIIDETRRQARGDISGSMLIKSFEASDNSGNTAISVVVAASNKMKNTIAGLRSSEGEIQPLPEKAGQPILQYLDENRESLMFTTGTKLVWDENGYPVLLSFGMAGNNCDPTDMVECVDNQEFSFINAESDAYGSLAQTYNLQGQSETTTRNGMITATDRTVSKEQDGVQTLDETVNELLQETESSSTMTSSVKGLVGLQKAYEWTENHPVTGHEINGVVIMWHPEKEYATRQFKKGQPVADKNGGTSTQYSPQSNESLGSDDEGF